MQNEQSDGSDKTLQTKKHPCPPPACRAERLISVRLLPIIAELRWREYTQSCTLRVRIVVVVGVSTGNVAFRTSRSLGEKRGRQTQDQKGEILFFDRAVPRYIIKPVRAKLRVRVPADADGFRGNV